MLPLTSVTTTSQTHTSHFPSWVDTSCKTVYACVRKCFTCIADLFRSFTKFLNPTRVQIGGPQNLVAFYQKGKPNIDKMTLHQIRAQNNDQLEANHSYIQWLFPLDKPSGSSATAPVMDQATIQAFRNSPALKAQVLKSFRVMLGFYGLQMDETTKVISRAPNFAARSANWLTPGNHNFLRISRIINSLHLFGMHDYGNAVYTIMMNIRANEGRGIIDDTVHGHWTNAHLVGMRG